MPVAIGLDGFLVVVREGMLVFFFNQKLLSNCDNGFAVQGSWSFGSAFGIARSRSETSAVKEKTFVARYRTGDIRRARGPSDPASPYAGL